MNIKGIKRIAYLICIIMLLFVLTPMGDGDEAHAASKPSGNWINYAAKSFAGGKGTDYNPYLIETAEQLAHLAKIVEKSHAKKGNYTKFKYYKLTKDIDLSKHYWTPIGRAHGNVYTTLLYGKAFRGNFNGDGHTISGLRTVKGDSFTGLFGVAGEIFYEREDIRDDKLVSRYDGYKGKDKYTTDYLPRKEVSSHEYNSGLNSIIHGLKLKKVSIDSNGYAGGLVGYAAFYADIFNCYVEGEVKGKLGAGGIIAKGIEVVVNRTGFTGELCFQ